MCNKKDRAPSWSESIFSPSVTLAAVRSKAVILFLFVQSLMFCPLFV